MSLHPLVARGAVALLPALFPALFPARLDAQSPPAPSRSPMTSIAREAVKVGHETMHARREAEWAARMTRGGFTRPALALTSHTGRPEAWWLFPAATYGALQKSNGAMFTPAMAPLMEKYGLADAEHLDDWRGIVCALRPDLRLGTASDLSQARGMEITTGSIGPGYDQNFAALVKLYAEIARRAGESPDAATCEVIAGAPAGSFMTLTAAQSPEGYDRLVQEQQRIFRVITPEEWATANTFMQNGVIAIETNCFALAPDMSIVHDELIRKDPAFWTPAWKKGAGVGAARR